MLFKFKVSTGFNSLHCSLGQVHYLFDFFFLKAQVLPFLLHLPDMESARVLPPKIPSPAQSAASKGELLPPPPPPPPQKEENSKALENAEEGKNESAPQQMLERGRTLKVADVSEATHESDVKEPASQGSAPLAEEEVQQKPVVGEAGSALRLSFWLLNLLVFSYEHPRGNTLVSYITWIGKCSHLDFLLLCFQERKRRRRKLDCL